MYSYIICKTGIEPVQTSENYWLSEEYLILGENLSYRKLMSKVSVRLADGLNNSVEDLVESGVFKDKTDAMHEAVRLLLLRYDSIES